MTQVAALPNPRLEILAETTSPLNDGAAYTSDVKDVGCYNNFKGYCFTDRNGNVEIYQGRTGGTLRLTDTITVTANTVAKINIARLARYVQIKQNNNSGGNQTVNELIVYGDGLFS